MTESHNSDQQHASQPEQPGYVSAPQQPQPVMPQTPPQRPQKKHGWIVAIVIAAVVFVLLAFGMWSCTSVMTSAVSFDSQSSSDVDYLTSDAVAVITIDGTIQYDGTTSSPEGLKVQLDRAAENARIRAVVLRVDSGGGTATAGEEMTTYIREFCEQTGKPVVVSSASINASAAYEISSQADCIFVAKTTAIGSIGTVMQITDASELLNNLGISVDNISSSNGKDSSYGTRSLSKKERAYYQDMVDKINKVFVQNVAEGRGMSEKEVQKLATGMTFTGLDAIENGLADEIGTKEDAVAKAAELAGVSTYVVVDLEPASSGWAELLDMSLSQDNSSLDALVKAIKEQGSDGNIAG